MSDHTFTTEPVIRPPDEITLIPHNVGFAYLGHRGGEDALALRINDRSVGPIAMVFTAEGARFVAEHLAGMADDLERLRAEWDAECSGAEGAA